MTDMFEAKNTRGTNFSSRIEAATFSGDLNQFQSITVMPEFVRFLGPSPSV